MRPSAKTWRNLEACLALDQTRPIREQGNVAFAAEDRFSMTPASHRWSHYSSKALAGLPKERLVAVLPIAATEQHGPHLPVSVDTDILEGLIAATEARLRGEMVSALFLPVQAIGKSNEHSRYPGTLTYSTETVVRVWSEIGDSVAASGVKRLMILNSHGGNSALMEVVGRDLRVKHGMLVVGTNWFQLGLPAGLFSADEERFGIHAGDLETSMMLALHPERVAMSEAADFGSAAAERAAKNSVLGVAPGARVAWQMQDLNPDGACGNAANASAETGQQVIDHVAAKLVTLLGEIAAFDLSSLAGRPSWG